MSGRGVLLTAVAGGLVGGLIAAVLVIALDDFQIKLGNVAEWVAGLGTIGALLYAGRALRIEIAARREDEKRFAVAEARRVRLSIVDPSAGQALKGDEVEVFVHGKVLLENNSNRDLSDVKISVYVGDVEVETFDLGEMISGTQQVRSYRKAWDPPSSPDGTHVAEARFSDSAGRHWLTKSDGALMKLDRS